MSHSSSLDQSPLLPVFLSTPFKLIPSEFHSRLIVTLLNRLLSEQIDEGDLDFLLNKILCINVIDANIKFYISLNPVSADQYKLVSVKSNRANDIEIKASVYDFIQLAARQQDPDTLVFQRRLVMQGSTELGLEIKNFLDSIDLQSSPGFYQLDKVLNKCLPVYNRVFR